MIAMNYWLAAVVVFLLAVKAISIHKSKPIKKYEVSFVTVFATEIHIMDILAKSEKQAIRFARRWHVVHRVVDCREVSNDSGI